MDLLALSVCQPWAWLILRPDVTDAGARAALRAAGQMKDVENRGWESAVRGWVLLHASGTRLPRASRTPDAVRGDWAGASLFAARRGVEVPLQGALPHGAFVGAIRIDGCERFVRSPWFVGPVGYTIAEAVPFARPVPWEGALKFFKVQTDGTAPAEFARLCAEIRTAGLAKAFAVRETGA